MRYSVWLPVIFLGLAGCAVSAEGPAQPAYGTVYVAPAQAPVVVAQPVVIVP
jgi:hypothetical protein